MCVELKTLVGVKVIVSSLQEVHSEIRRNGVSSREEGILYHQLGSLYGLLGKTKKQKKAWRKALVLDPDNKMILSSLESLQN